MKACTILGEQLLMQGLHLWGWQLSRCITEAASQ